MSSTEDFDLDGVDVPYAWTWGLDRLEHALLRELYEANLGGKPEIIAKAIRQVHDLDQRRATEDASIRAAMIAAFGPTQRGPWITTFSGRAFHLCDPRPQDFVIEDAAHSLARKPRWGGHTRQSIPVAQHCVLIARHLPDEDQYEGLMHECEEPYTGDVHAALKAILGPRFKRAIIHPIERAASKAYGFRWPYPKSVKHEDLRALATERRDQGHAEPPPGYTWNQIEQVEPWPERLDPWSEERAEQEFLDAFRTLRAKRGLQ